MPRKTDSVMSNFYDPQLMGKIEYSNNPTRNRVQVITRFYVNLLTQMATSRFKWDGLPDQALPIDVRFMEMTLLHNGLAVFFHEDKVYDQYLVMRSGGIGPINIYDNPTWFQVQGGTGDLAVFETLGTDECVPIWSNHLRIPEYPHIVMWANRMAEIDRTVEISAFNARQTKFISVPESLRLSADNVLKQMNEGTLTVVGSEELSQVVRAIETVDLESHPSKLMNLLVSKAKMWNEIMTYLGINNSNQDKRERLVADEVSANNEQIDLVKEMNLNTRRFACEQINDMFGLDMSVDFMQSNDGNIQGADQGISSNGFPTQDNTTNWGN